jgi:hypothetical protein
MVYPKMGTLYRLQHWGTSKKWTAVDELLPETAALHFIDPADLVVTEKLDGANAWVNLAWTTIGKHSGLLAENGDQFWVETAIALVEACAARREALSSFGWPDLTVYGELVGPQVNSSGRIFDERQVIVFDIAGADGRFFRWDAVKAFCEAAELPRVSECYWSGSLEFESIREYVLALESPFKPGVPAEGIVVRDRNDTSPHRRRIAKIRRRDFS